MELFVTAPIRLNFNLNTSVSAYKTDLYYQFWKKLEKLKFKSENIDKVIYYKTELPNKTNGSYDNHSKIDLTTLGIDLYNITNKVLISLENNKFISKYFKSVKVSKINVYDNTIGILDLKIKLHEADMNSNDDFTKNYEYNVKLFIDELFNIIQDDLKNFFNFISKNDNAFILQKLNKDHEYNDFVDFHRKKLTYDIMWVSCALVFAKKDIGKVNILDEWLRDAIEPEEIKSLKNDTKGYSLEWLRYAFREDVDDINKLWEIMFLAQYNYAVIEIIVYNLKIIINESYNLNNNDTSFLKNLFKKNKIIIISEKFEAISAIAYLHTTEYKDIKKYIPRNYLTVFNRILEVWTFDDILNNTENLLSAAKDRVALIYNKISSKNNFYTDILLTSIGFFAIIDLVLNFSQYSRAYTSDIMISSREDGDSFLYTLSSIPIDIFIGSGFLVSMFLLIIYFIYRKKILP